jgi:hypothetical protein
VELLDNLIELIFVEFFDVIFKKLVFNLKKNNHSPNNNTNVFKKQ